MPPPAVTRQGGRRIWFLVHGWLGANFALLMALLFLSGTLASISHEIDWLFDKRVRAEGRDRNIGWDEVVARVAMAAPGERILSIMLGPERVITPEWDLPFAARVAIRDSAGRERIAYIDLQRGAVTGIRSYIDFPFLMRQLHYNLFVHPQGFYINIGLAALTLGAIVTGLVNYRRFWRGFFRAPRWHAKWRVLWGDIHRLVAIWSLLFLILISATGLWYLVPDLVQRFGSGHAAPAQAVDGERLPLDDLAAMAEASIPGFNIRFIALPSPEVAEVSFWGQADEVLLHHRGNRVVLDAVTGEVISRYRASEAGVLMRWTDTADALHFGSFGGLAGRIAWCLFGLATSLLIISGTIIRAYRLSGEMSWRLPMLGRWRWLNLAFLLLPSYGLLITLVG